MGSALQETARFLALSSLQLCAIGAVALVLVRWTRASGRAACRILAAVVVLPLLSLVAEQIPERPVRILPAWLAAAGDGAASRPRVAAPAAQAGALVALPATSPSGSPVPGPAAAAAASAAGVPGAVPPRSGGRRIDLLTALGIAWAAAAVVLAARVARSLVALGSALRGAAPPTDRATRLVVDDCLARAALPRSTRVLVSDSCTVPFVAGLVRPRVVVPRRLSGERLEFALLHELAHVRHRDHLWVAPELALRTIYCFHPVVHRVLTRLHEEREHRCDVFATRLTGRCAAYAEFLLDEVRGATLHARGHAALGLGGGGGALARRVRRLLDGGGQDMERHTSERIASGAVAVSVALTLACGTASEATGDEGAAAAPEVAAAEPAAAATEAVNATPTATPGRYHVMPELASLTEVFVFQRGGPYGREHRVVLAPGDGYVFDAATGFLDLRQRIDDAKQMVSVRGVRTVPWAWRASEPLEEGSVRVLLGDREGRRGTDFEVDAAKGRIRFLRTELCDPNRHYYISYGFPADPRKPGAGRGGAIGNHPDRAAVRRFLGIDESRTSSADAAKSIGTNASPTADPRRWTIVQPMESASLRVGIVARGAPGQVRWLERSTDWSYDETTATLTLLGTHTVDAQTELLFVHGVPRERGVFLAHRPLEAGSVKVAVDGRELVEGTGFRVDLATGRITVLDAAITREGAKFRVSAGGWTYGN